MADDVHAAILAIPKNAWTPACDSDRMVRPGAWVAELTGMLNLAGWPKGMRVIVRKERPHPGAQLRFTDIGGRRFTCFATDTKGGQLADLELRHRLPARCEDRIRAAKDTGLRNLPPARLRRQPDLDRTGGHGLRTPGLDADARPPRPSPPLGTQRLRLRIFAVAGRITRGGRRLRLRLAATWPRATQISAAVSRLQALEPG
jgi:hypothetical protein